MAAGKQRAVVWILCVALACGAAVGALVLAQREGRARAVVEASADQASSTRAEDLAAGAAREPERRSSAEALTSGGIEARPGVRLAGPGRLEGRVIERGGGPVAGARVQLHTLPPTGTDVLARIYHLAKFADHWQTRLEPVATAVSAADGAFSFEGVRAGTYFLEARAGLYVPELAVLARVDSEGEGGPVDLHVRAGGRVVGRVLRPDGSPAAGARVIVYPGPTAFLAAARHGDLRLHAADTDRDGRFVVAGVPPGDGYDATASGERFALTHATGFAVAAGLDTEVEIRAQAGATVRGTVVARRADGEGGERVEPIAGAYVAALPRGLRGVQFSSEVIAATAARTGPDGAYVLRNVPAGEVDVAAVAPGLLPSKGSPLRALDGADLTAEPIELEGGPQVTLRFLDDLGAPIEGVETSWYVTDFEELAFEPTVTPLLLQAIEGFEFPRSDANGEALAGPFPGSPPHLVYCWRAGYAFTPVSWDPATGPELEVRMSRGGAVEGIVIDVERAEPVTRFEVKGSSRLEGDPLAPTSANPFSGGLWIEHPEGRFRLDAVAADGDPLRFSAPGYLPADVAVDVRPGEVARGVIVKMRPGGTVRGRVLDAEGEPIAGAQVAAVDRRGRAVHGSPRNPRGGARSYKEALGQEFTMTMMDLFAGLGVVGAGCVVSGEDGAYELVALPEGPAVVLAAHRDFADGTSAEVQVRAGEPLEGVDVVLTAGGGVHGTVRDRFGTPVPGAIVLLVSTERMASTDPSPRWARQGGSAADGTYRIEHVEPGAYFVVCTRGDAGLHVTSFLGTLNLELVTVPPDRMVRLDLVDSSAAAVRLHGRVLEGGKPVHGGGLVALSFEGESVLGVDAKVAEVKSDGAYAFEGLAPGGYSFTYQSDGPPVWLEVEVPDAPDVRLDLTLPGARLEGRVLDAGSGDPIAGAEVALRRAGASDLDRGVGLLGTMMRREGRVAHARSDREGRFAFPRLQAGRYRLEAGPPRFGEVRSRWAAADPVEIDVAEGGSPDPVEIRLSPALELRGRVLDEGNRPVAGARVVALPHEASDVRLATGRSDDDGSFTLRGLRSGGYDVRASGEDGVESRAEPVELGAAPPPEVVLVVARGVEVIVRVTDALGAPVQGATGRLVPLSAGGAAAHGVERTLESIFRGEGLSGPDGVLRLGRFAPGEYRLEVGRGTLRAEREPVRLEGGALVSLDLELE